MEFLTYYLLEKDTELSDSSENETGFTHKICKKSRDTRLNSYANFNLCDKKSSSIYIGFPIDSEFEYTKIENIKSKNFLEVTRSNIDELIRLVCACGINTAADIENYIIDKFNNDNLILVTYNDNLKYNKTEELAYLIFNINNELNKLGKIIKLYIIKNTDNQNNININNLEYVNLGEKIIPVEIENENEWFRGSIKLFQLINRLTGGFDYKSSYVLEHYNIDIGTEDLSCEECSTKEWFNLCDKCIANKIKKIINDIYTN